MNKQNAYTAWNRRIIWIATKKGAGQVRENFQFMSQFAFRDKVIPRTLQKIRVRYIIPFFIVYNGKNIITKSNNFLEINETWSIL